MSVITLRAMSVCAGGNHLTMRLLLDGTPRAELVLTPDDMSQSIDAETIKTVMVALLKVYKVGKSAATIKAALADGVDIVVP